jgi:SAM-dependent methyltransferase
MSRIADRPRPGDPRLTRDCPVCGVRSPRRPVPDPGRPRAARCSACDLVFIDPLPASAVSPKSYAASYYEPWRTREERPRRALWVRRLRLVEERTGGPCALLDVGCGDGHFLQLARERGFAVEGIEFSPEGARLAAGRLGRPVAVGDLARDHLLPGPFDALTLWHVLEHLPDAAAMLRAARERLRPGGLLVVAVPNLDNLPMRLAYRLARRRPLPLYEEGAGEIHLSHFSPETLAGALRRHRFEAIAIRPDGCALTLPKRLVDSAAGLLSRFAGRLLTDALVAFARRTS